MKTFKIIIKRVDTEEYELVLDNNSMMAAFDEARRLVAARNKTSKIGKYHVTKIDQIKE